MSSLPTVISRTFSNGTYISIAIFVCAVIYMTINSDSVTSANYLAGIVAALLCSCLMPIGAFCICVFFTIPFTAVLKLPIEAFSFMTLLQVLLVCRTIFFNKLISPSVLAGTVICATVTQLVPFISFDQSISNLILLILNLWTFYCIYLLTKNNKLNINLVFFGFAIGVLVAGLISQNYGISVSEQQDFRFCGLWTDPNFWGMFCLIGITTCLILGFQKPIRFIIMAPIIIGLAMQGFLTLSHTFIVVCSLMVIIITLSYRKKSIWTNVMVMSVLAIGIVYAIPYAISIFSERSLDSNDISNGRFHNTAMIYTYVINHPVATFFGLGYSNTINVIHANHFGHGATHNTYADLFAEFGGIFCLLFIFALIRNNKVIKKFISRLYTLPGLIFCVLIFYMGTLSMLKYALVFLMFGIYFGFCNQSHQSLEMNISRISN